MITRARLRKADPEALRRLARWLGLSDVGPIGLVVQSVLRKVRVR